MRAIACRIVSGFILSLLLTLGAYFLVVGRLLQGNVLLLAVMSLAYIQAAVQLLLFLHLGDEPSPKWKLMTFWFMLTVLIILVGGTLWIMSNLNYNMMPKL